jgi:hypothetical protein
VDIWINPGGGTGFVISASGATRADGTDYIVILSGGPEINSII